jgi:hypothetical protein
MSLQSWQETLVAAQVDGPALNTSIVATSILPSHAKVTLPAGFWSIGKTLRLRGMARVSNIVTTPGTLTLDLRLGAVVAFNGGAMQLSSTAHTTLPLIFEFLLTCRSIGAAATATLIGSGQVNSQAISLTAVPDSTTSPAGLVTPNVTPVVGTGFDSTVASVLDLFATFSISNAGNALTLHQYVVESLN